MKWVTLVFVSILFIVELVAGFEVVNESFIQRERELYNELASVARSRLEELEEETERNQYAHSPHDNAYVNHSGNSTNETQFTVTNVIPLSSTPHKSIQLVSSIENTEERAFYHLIDLNRSISGKLLLRNETSTAKNDYLLMIKVTSKAISISKPNGPVLSLLPFTFSIDLIKVDFSSFEEDNTLLFLTATNEILVLRTDVQLQGSSYEGLTADILIPTRRSFGINVNEDSPVIAFLQHKLHGNKYIVISYGNGDIFVLNKDLEMKSAIAIHSPLRRVLLFNGIVFAVKGQEIVFINLLGGNSILLACYNYYDIIDVFFDSGDNLLFYIDSGGRLIVMTIKLSISKANENECSSVFYYQLPSFTSVDSDSRLIGSKAELFMLTSEYIGHIDLNQLATKGLHIEDYAIYQLSTTPFADKSEMRGYRNSQYEVYHSNVMGLFYLIHNSNLLFRVENAAVATQGAVSSKPSQSSRNDGRVECNGNFICKILFNTATNNKNTVFYIYVVVIILIAGVVIYYQRTKSKEERKTKEYEEDKKKTNAVTNEKLQEMLEQIRKIEKYHQKNPLDQSKAQGTAHYDNQDPQSENNDAEDSDLLDEEIDEDDLKGHSN